jgi:proline iminopeptidase
MDWESFTAPGDAGPIVGWASGSGPPLLLLHGGPGVSEYLVVLEPELPGWRAIRYQQRGVAPSTASGPFTVERHVADAVAVLAELGTGPAYVLGHSWGGFLALQLAVARPDLVTGLVIVDPLGVTGDGGMAAGDAEMTRRLSPAAAAQFAGIIARLDGPEASHEDELAVFRLLYPGNFARPATAPPPPADLELNAACNEETVNSALEHMAGGFSGRLRAVTAPAVFVLGEQDPLPPAGGQQTAALMPRAEVRLIPGAGHLPWHEQPGCVAAALDRVRALAGQPTSG